MITIIKYTLPCKVMFKLTIAYCVSESVANKKKVRWGVGS